MASERNYDELFAEMLMSIDRHTEELDKHSKELSRISLEVQANRVLADQAYERVTIRLDEMAERSTAANDRQMEMILNTATILDRIIKENQLRL